MALIKLKSLLTCCAGVKAHVFVIFCPSEGLREQLRDWLLEGSVIARRLTLASSVFLYETCDVLAMRLQAFLKLSLSLRATV